MILVSKSTANNSGSTRLILLLRAIKIWLRTLSTCFINKPRAFVISLRYLMPRAHACCKFYIKAITVIETTYASFVLFLLVLNVSSSREHYNVFVHTHVLGLLDGDGNVDALEPLSTTPSPTSHTTVFLLTAPSLSCPLSTPTLKISRPAA